MIRRSPARRLIMVASLTAILCLAATLPFMDVWCSEEKIELAWCSACIGTQRKLYVSIKKYSHKYERAPRVLQELIEEGYLDEKGTRCPKDPNVSYIYFPEHFGNANKILLICHNHRGTSIATMGDGAIVLHKESEERK